MPTVDEKRRLVGISSDYTDAEIELWWQAALADLRRIGVREELLDGSDPLVNAACALYLKANYGFDNDDADKFRAAYVETAKCLANSTANQTLFNYEAEL